MLTFEYLCVIFLLVLHFTKKVQGGHRTMKKLITLLLAVALVLSLAACGGGNSETSTGSETPNGTNTDHTHVEETIPAVEPTCTETGLTEGKRCSECGETIVEQEVVPALGHTTDSGTCERCGQSFGIWYTDCYADDFNQPVTDQWYIINKSSLSGTFSNSATTDSALTADILYDYDNWIVFFLYEYGSNLVKNSSERNIEVYNITMRTPDGKDHNMTGAINYGGDRIYLDENYTNEVLTALKGEGDIMFRLENAERTVENYLITVPASNFAEEYTNATGN